MNRKLGSHLVSYSEWKEWDDYEDYLHPDEEIRNDYDAYADTPSKKECDKICAESSGKVVSYFIERKK